MHLVENWRDAWKWYAEHCFALIAFVNGVWFMAPADVAAWLTSVDPNVQVHIHVSSFILSVVGGAARLIQQTAPVEGAPDRTIHVQAGEVVAIRAPESPPKP
jgi:hypothetical protein